MALTYKRNVIIATSEEDFEKEVLLEVAGVKITPMEGGEGSDYWTLGFYACESTNGFAENHGYILNASMVRTSDKHVVLYDIEVFEDPHYEKTVRTREQIVDRLISLSKEYRGVATESIVWLLANLALNVDEDAHKSTKLALDIYVENRELLHDDEHIIARMYSYLCEVPPRNANI